MACDMAYIGNPDNPFWRSHKEIHILGRFVETECSGKGSSINDQESRKKKYVGHMRIEQAAATIDLDFT